VLEGDEALTGLQYSTIHFDPDTAEPLISIIMPLTLPRTGKRGCFLVADLMLRPVWNLIAQTGVDKNQSIYVTDNQHRVIAHQDPSVVLRKSRFIYSPEYAIQQGLVFPVAVVAVQPFMLGQNRYQVVIERERMEVLATLKKMFLIVFLVLLVALPFLARVLVDLCRSILIAVQCVLSAAK